MTKRLEQMRAYYYAHRDKILAKQRRRLFRNRKYHSLLKKPKWSYVHVDSDSFWVEAERRVTEYERKRRLL